MSARDDSLRRLRARLDEEPDLGRLRAALREIPGAPPGAYTRVLRRLDAPGAALEATRPRRLAPVVVTGMLLAAAVAAVVLRPAAPLDRPLEGQSNVALDTHVHADWSGSGVVSGRSGAPRIVWTSGRLRLDVDPGQGVDLRVTTREAEVRVVGTVLTVDRDVFGTTVGVDHGKVEVTCARGDHVFVEGGGSHRCAPTDPAGVLAAARAEEERGAAPATILALTAGVTAEGDVGRELALVTCTARHAGGDLSGAVACVEAALTSPGDLRRDDLLRLGAAAALRSKDCAHATRWLEALGDPRGPDLLTAAGCAATP